MNYIKIIELLRMKCYYLLNYKYNFKLIKKTNDFIKNL